MNQHVKRPIMTDAEVRKDLMIDSLGTIDAADSTGSRMKRKRPGMRRMGIQKPANTEAGRVSMESALTQIFPHIL